MNETNISSDLLELHQRYILLLQHFPATEHRTFLPFQVKTYPESMCLWSLYSPVILKLKRVYYQINSII